MNSESYQKQMFEVGDLVCYKQPHGSKLCGIITETNMQLVKIYWCINNNDVDISPLSYPPIRRNGWIAAEILLGTGDLEIVSKKKLDKQ